MNRAKKKVVRKAEISMKKPMIGIRYYFCIQFQAFGIFHNSKEIKKIKVPS